MCPTYRASVGLPGQAPLDYVGLAHEILKVKLQPTGGARTWSHQVRELTAHPVIDQEPGTLEGPDALGTTIVDARPDQVPPNRYPALEERRRHTAIFALASTSHDVSVPHGHQSRSRS